MTVTDLEMKLKYTNQAKKSVSLFAPDGASISKGTSLQHLLHIPYFVLKIDDLKEFNVLSEKSFSLRNQKFTLNAAEKVIFDDCKELGMRDRKAVEISRFMSKF